MFPYSVNPAKRSQISFNMHQNLLKNTEHKQKNISDTEHGKLLRIMILKMQLNTGVGVSAQTAEYENKIWRQ